MSTQRYRVITQSGIHIGEEFYELNAILNLTAIGAKYLLLNKQIALAAGQAPVGEDPDDPSEDDVMIDIKVGTQTETVSLTKLREMFPSIKGDKGDPGEQGPIGSRGQKGDKGDKGEQGRGISLAGVVAAFANLPQEADDGQVYVTQDTGHGWAWFNDAWNDLGQFKGDKGDQGPIGPQGIRGQVGEKGDKGEPGDSGSPAFASRAELGATNAAASEAAAAGHASDAAASAESALALAAEAEGYRDDAEAAKTAAATSEANAATHESNALTSKTNAATSETNAASHASAASGSASAAAASATTAGNHATAAATSDANAGASAFAAATSESNASGFANSAGASAASAATSETNAHNALVSFTGVYYGALASDPALDPNGAAVTDGDFYFNTATKKMRFFNGTAWADMVSGGTQKRFIYAATAGQTTFTGADTFSNVLAYTPGCIEVVVNGLWVPYSEYTATNGTSIVLNSGSTAGDVVYVFALAAFTIADVCARSLNGSDILDKAAFRANIDTFTRSLNGSDVIDKAAFRSNIGSAPAIVSYSAVLGANVGIPSANTWVDACQIAQGTSGTFLVVATVALKDTSGSAPLCGRLTDGTTVFGDTGIVYNIGAGARTQGTIIAIVTNPAGNLKIQATIMASSSGGVVVANDSGQGQDTKIVAIKIA